MANAFGTALSRPALQISCFTATNKEVEILRENVPVC